MMVVHQLFCSQKLDSVVDTWLYVTTAEPQEHCYMPA